MSSVIDWLIQLPALLGFLVILAIGLAIAIGFTLAAERAFKDDARARTGASVATIVGVVAGLYAVLVAFVIVNEWQAFNNAQSQVSNESAAIASTYFNASVLPEPGRSQIQRATLAYDRVGRLRRDPVPRDTRRPRPVDAARAAVAVRHGRPGRADRRSLRVLPGHRRPDREHLGGAAWPHQLGVVTPPRSAARRDRRHERRTHRRGQRARHPAPSMAHRHRRCDHRDRVPQPRAGPRLGPTLRRRRQDQRRTPSGGSSSGRPPLQELTNVRG